jgi:hypothetical protein
MSRNADENETDQVSFVLATHQYWKLIAAGALVVVSAIAIVVGGRDVRSVWGMRLAITGIAVGLASLIALFLAVRCPRCGARLVWLAVKEQSAGNWLPWLLQLRSCPKCRFDPASDDG